MNKYLYFAVGAVAGAFACYKIVYNKLRTEFDEKLDAAITEYRESKETPNKVEPAEETTNDTGVDIPVEQQSPTVSYSTAPSKNDFEAAAEKYTHPEDTDIPVKKYNTDDRVPIGWDNDGMIRKVDADEYNDCPYRKFEYDVYEDGYIIDRDVCEEIELSDLEHSVGYDPVGNADYGEEVYIINDELRQAYVFTVMAVRWEDIVAGEQ